MNTRKNKSHKTLIESIILVILVVICCIGFFRFTEAGYMLGKSITRNISSIGFYSWREIIFGIVTMIVSTQLARYLLKVKPHYVPLIGATLIIPVWLLLGMVDSFIMHGFALQTGGGAAILSRISLLAQVPYLALGSIALYLLVSYAVYLIAFREPVKRPK